MTHISSQHYSALWLWHLKITNLKEDFKSRFEIFWFQILPITGLFLHVISTFQCYFYMFVTVFTGIKNKLDYSWTRQSKYWKTSSFSCVKQHLKIIHDRESVQISQKQCYFYMFVILFRGSNKKRKLNEPVNSTRQSKVSSCCAVNLIVSSARHYQYLLRQIIKISSKLRKLLWCS